MLVHRSRIVALMLATAAGLLAAGSAEASLRLCNKLSTPVSVAVGYLDGGKGWTAEGWWTVAPSACETMVESRLSGSYVYLLVDGGLLPPPSSQKGGWFCTDNDGFVTRNADYADKKRQLLCESAGLNIEQFREVPLKGSNLTFNLTK